MHFIDNVVHALLNTIHAVSYWMRHYNGLCKKFNNCICSVIIGAALLLGNTALKLANILTIFACKILQKLKFSVQVLRKVLYLLEISPNQFF